ncbi:hypothetical protein [Candidatus Albibeggiatoa sp. nov. NOAA]|uniref:hypothetical protein n=1 Tax=Candidatus Albibeggiatoa sp. nov. NOAA TaxID=3162724 RepID=UPI0032F9FEE6|nr:toll/interleukin-1 receptor domain-containing protein [Thiotrichaceae bacterium]
MEKKHIFYISYADADNGWVEDFVKNLTLYLHKQLGEIDDGFIWAKYMLYGNETKQTQQKYLNNSTYLIAILSPAYFKTINTQEIEEFNNLENLIIVEHDKVNRPEELKNFVGYSFWKEERNGKIKQFTKNICGISYTSTVKQIARDLATKFKPTAKKLNLDLDQVFIFLYSSNEYIVEQNDLRQFLKYKNVSILSKTANLKNELQQANLFIQLGTDKEGNALYKIANKLNIPIKRWTNNKNDAETSPSYFYSDDIAKFGKEIGYFIDTLHKKNINANSKPSPLNQYVFINAIEEDRNFVIDNIQKKLNTNNIESVLIPSEEFTSSKNIKKSLEQSLLSHYAVIIVCDSAPLYWVYQQILFCKDIEFKRERKFQVIAVFNKPPPNELDKLGICLNNLKIWNDSDNYIDEFIKSLNI